MKTLKCQIMDLRSFSLKTFVFFSILSCYIQACQSDKLTADKKAVIEKEIKKNVDNYLKALTNLDTLEMRQFYFDGNDFLMSMDGTIIKGKLEVKKVLENIAQSFQEMSEIKIDNVNISILSKESAAYTMEFTWTAITFQNDTLRRYGTATYALKKVGSDWKAVHLVGLHLPKKNGSKDEFDLTSDKLISN